MDLACIVPPAILENIARRGSPAQRERARRVLLLDARHRTVRLSRAPAGPARAAGPAAAPAAPQRTVSTADGAETLPGRLVRSEGAPVTASP